MKALFIDRYGGPEVMQVGEVPDPSMGADDVLIEVRAAGLNPIDFKTRDGVLRRVLHYRMPLVLGNECAGVVRDVGPEVKRFRAGDEVYVRVDKRRMGTVCELVAAAESTVGHKPARASMEEAAGVPLAGLTARQALFDDAALGAGDKVLIHAGAGGVGSLAIQIASKAGAHVITTCSEKSADLARSLGADEIVDYRAQRFEEVVSDCDVVLDTLGGDTLRRSFDVLRRGGRLVSISGDPDRAFAAKLALGRVKTAVVMWRGRKTFRLARERGITYSYRFMDPDGQGLDALAAEIDAGALRPVVDRVFALEQAKDAMAYLESGHAHGKVIVVPSLASAS